MITTLETQRFVDSDDLHIPYRSRSFDSFGHVGGLRSSKRGLVGQKDSFLVSARDPKADCKLGGRGSVWSIGVSQDLKIHLRSGLCFNSSFKEVGKPCLLGFLKKEEMSQRGVIGLTAASSPLYLNHTDLSALQNVESLQDTKATRPGVPLKQGAAASDLQLKQMIDHNAFSIPENLSAPLVSLGFCGNALIMRFGLNGRCFHHEGLACGLADLGVCTDRSNILYVPDDNRAFGLSSSGLRGNASKMKGLPTVSLLEDRPITTKKDRQNKSKKVRKMTTLTRDLYERSPFHVLEVIFCYPLLNPGVVATNFQIPPSKSLKELGNILNQAAFGLAGLSATWLLFVASRILWLDGSLNKHSVTSLAMGLGLASLSWVMKRVSDALQSLPDAYSRSRVSQQAFVTGLQREVQNIALNTILLIFMCVMGGG